MAHGEVSGRIIGVSHFGRRGLKRLEIRGDKYTCRTYRDLRNVVGEMLTIKEKSRALFGIFKVTDFEFDVYSPKELCKGMDELPLEDMEVGFYRLSFDRKLESEALSEDLFAFLFTYFEVRFLHRYGTYISDPDEVNTVFCEIYETLKTEKNKERKRMIKFILDHKLALRRMKVIPYCEEAILHICQARIENAPLEEMDISMTSDSSGMALVRMYMTQLESLQLFYWCYYYKVEGILCGENAPLLASCLNLNKQFEIIVTLSKTCLHFLGETKSGMVVHLLDIPWCTIRFIAKSGNIFSFQIQITDMKDDEQYLIINVFTYLCDYLYSMAAYLLESQAKLLKNLEGSDYSQLFSEIPKMMTSIVPSHKKDLARGLLCCLLPTSKFPQPPQFSEYAFCAKDGFFTNEFYVPSEYDMMKLYVRNVKKIPAGPGEYFNGKTIYISCFNHAEELRQKSSSDASIFSIRSKTHGRLARVPIQQPLESGKMLEACIEEIDDSLEAITVRPKIITLHTFWKGPFEASVPKYASVESLKICIARYLNIKESSLKIFGLFMCSEEYPFDFGQKLCLDSELVPDSIHFCFRRLSFDRKLEANICEQDNQAVKLLWSEAKYAFEKDAILPALSDASKRNLRKILKARSSRFQFTELLTEVWESWWDYYYRVDCSPELPSSDVPAENQPAHVAISLDHLFLLDKSALHFKKISINNVLGLWTPVAEPNTPNLLAIDVLMTKKHKNEKETENILECVAIHTIGHEFFLSLSKEVFRLRKDIQISRQEYVSEKFSNLQFKGPSYNLLQSPDVTCCSLNPTFTGLTKQPKQKYCRRK